MWEGDSAILGWKKGTARHRSDEGESTPNDEAAASSASSRPVS